LTRLLIDVGTVAADRNGCPAVALGWRHKPDAAMAVPAPGFRKVVIPLISTSGGLRT
jgi:hypothetical protein